MRCGERIGRGLGLVVALAGLAGLCACALPRAPTPDFSAALVELRRARELLIEPPGSALLEPEARAAQQIEGAIGQLVARMPAGTHATPTTAADETVVGREDRLHYALQHLDAARLALDRDDADPERRTLRNQVVSYIARAQAALGHALGMLLRH